MTLYLKMKVHSGLLSCDAVSQGDKVQTFRELVMNSSLKINKLYIHVVIYSLKLEYKVSETRPSPLRDFTQRRLVVSYRRFGTTCCIPGAGGRILLYTERILIDASVRTRKK